MVTPVISANSSRIFKENIEKDRTEKIETADEEKNENKGKIKPGEFILTHHTNSNFFQESKISYRRNNTNLPTTYSKVLQQPPKIF